MPQLIQTKDFTFLALKDDINITDSDRQQFLHQTFRDFPSQRVDVPTSIALLAEFEKCPLQDNAFKNELEQPYPETLPDDKYVYVFPQYSVSSDTIPELLKAAGIQLLRTQRTAYLAPGETASEPYKLVKQDGTPFEDTNVEARAGDSKIDIYDDVLALTKEEYHRYLNIKHTIDSGHFTQLSQQDMYFCALVDTFVTQKDKTDIIFHEIKHMKNKLIMFDRKFDNTNFALSGVDYYKINIDDEMSAKLSEVIRAINTYNQQTDKNDLSVFESTYILQQLLYNKTPEIRANMITDTELVVHMVCEHFNVIFAKGYKPQFMHDTLAALSNTPLNQICDKPNDAEYDIIRKKMFTYSVYNPATGNYINMDLSKYVPEHTLDAKTIGVINKIQQDTIQERQSRQDKLSKKPDQNIITTAHKQYRNLVLNTEYRKKLTELQNQGFDYSMALDFVSGMNFVAEGTEKLGQKPSSRLKTNQVPIRQPEKPKFNQGKNKLLGCIKNLFVKKKAKDSITYK